MKKKNVKITPKELNEYVLNFETNENEFRGKVLSWSMSVEQLIGEVITKHFVSESNNLKFSSIVLPHIFFEKKITILQSILDLKEYVEIKKEYNKIIGNLNSIKDYRNKLAHWHSDLFENIVNSKYGKKDIIILSYKKGNVISKKITEGQQKSIIKLIRKSISDLRGISMKINRLNKQKNQIK